MTRTRRKGTYYIVDPNHLRDVVSRGVSAGDDIEAARKANKDAAGNSALIYIPPDAIQRTVEVTRTRNISEDFNDKPEVPGTDEV